MTDTEKQARALAQQIVKTLGSRKHADDCDSCIDELERDLRAYGSSEYDRGLRDGREQAAQIVENAVIPESFRRTVMYTESEAGADELLQLLTVAIRQISDGG